MDSEVRYWTVSRNYVTAHIIIIIIIIIISLSLLELSSSSSSIL
jgi:hypothetical protein